jgi:hypothetical protein
MEVTDIRWIKYFWYICGSLFTSIHGNHISQLFGLKLRQSRSMTMNQSCPFTSFFWELLLLTVFPCSLNFLSDILPKFLFLSCSQSSCWIFSFHFYIEGFCGMLSLFTLKSCQHSHSIICEFITERCLVFKVPLTFLVSYSILPEFFKIRSLLIHIRFISVYQCRYLNEHTNMTPS